MGVHGIVAQFRPLVLGNAQDEEVVVVSGLADQGQEPAGIRIKHHHGPGLPLQKTGAQVLQVQVDGQGDVVAGPGFDQHLLVMLASQGIHFHLFLALGPPKPVLPGQFQALLAHGIPKGQGRVFLQFLLVGLGHVAQDVGHQRPRRIMALLADNDLPPRARRCRWPRCGPGPRRTGR